MREGKLHWSDCAVNNEPLSEAGPCDCGGYDPKRDGLPAPYDPTRCIARDLADLISPADEKENGQ